MIDGPQDTAPFLRPDDGSLPVLGGRDEFGLTPGQRQKVEQGAVLGRSAKWLARDARVSEGQVERVMAALGLQQVEDGPSNRGALPAVRGEKFLPWMNMLAMWESQQPGHVTRAQARTVATSLAGVKVSEDAIRLLRLRPDYTSARERFASDLVYRARQKMEARMPEYADAHFKALELADLADDHDALGRIAEPMLDRIWPRKHEAPRVAAIIQVNIGGQSLEQVLETEATVVEVERVEDSD